MRKKHVPHILFVVAFAILGTYFAYFQDAKEEMDTTNAAFVAEVGSGSLPIDDTPTAWYDFSDSNTIYSDKACTTGSLVDGDRVGCVEDKSGNGNDIFNDPSYNMNGGRDGTEQSLITDNPTYKINQNGSLSAIRFFANPGAGDVNSAEYLYTGISTTRKNLIQPSSYDPINNLGLDDGDHTIFMVIDPISNAANYQDIIGNSGIDIQTYGLRLNSSDKLEILRSVIGPVIKTGAIDVDGTATKTISTTSSSNDFDLRIDGLTDGSAASYAPVFQDGSIAFGLSEKDQMQGYNGNINEIIIYPTALGLCDRQKVEKYLMDKWGQTFPGFDASCFDLYMTGGTEVSEFGATTNLDIELTVEPDPGQRVDIELQNADGQLTLDETEICFVPTGGSGTYMGNLGGTVCTEWDDPQTITIGAFDDDVEESTPHTGAISFSVSSGDLGYDGIDTDDYTVNIIDNDLPVEPPLLTEGGRRGRISSNQKVIHDWLLGCTDPSDSNYKETAAWDDGSCAEDQDQIKDRIENEEALVYFDNQAQIRTDLEVEECLHFTQYLKKADPANNPDEVLKWQKYFNLLFDKNIPETGYFGPITESAVKDFQSLYEKYILSPWNIDIPTGHILQTTRSFGNASVGCPEGLVIISDDLSFDHSDISF